MEWNKFCETLCIDWKLFQWQRHSHWQFFWSYGRTLAPAPTGQLPHVILICTCKWFNINWYIDSRLFDTSSSKNKSQPKLHMYVIYCCWYFSRKMRGVRAVLLWIVSVRSVFSHICTPRYITDDIIMWFVPHTSFNFINISWYFLVQVKTQNRV